MSVNAPTSAPNSFVTCSDEALSVGAGIGERAAPWVMSFGVLLAYLSFLTRNYYWDGVDFAFNIEQSQGLSAALIHPHHLLYNAFGFFIYHIFDALGWHVRAVNALQITNSVLSATCARLLFRLLRHVLRSTYFSLVLTLLFSFSATWWKYSSDADSYVPSVLLLLVCLNLLLAARKPRPLAVALAHAAGMCMHQLAVLFYPVIVLAIFSNNPGLSVRRRALLTLKYSVATACVTLAANYYCFHLQTGKNGIAAFAGWLTSYLHGPHSYSFSFDLRSNTFYTLRGQTRLFFEGRLNWLEGLMSPPVVALLGVLLLVTLFLVFVSVRGLKTLAADAARAARLESGLRPLAAACSLWACAYLIFLFFWYPYFTPYRLFYLPALIVLLGIALTRYGIPRTPARLRYMAMFVAAMTLSNFLFFIYPLSHLEKNPPLVMALEMNKVWPRGTVIYYADSNADNRLFEYFNPATAWRKSALAVDEVFEGELRKVYRQGGAAWADASALDRLRSSPEGALWLAEHTREDRKAELVNHSYRIIFFQIFPTNYGAGDGSPDGPASAKHANEDSIK